MQLITVVQSKCPAVNINTKHAESMAPTVNHTNGCRHPSQRGNQSPLWYTGKCKEISHSLSQHISCLISWMDTGLNKTGFPLTPLPLLWLDEVVTDSSRYGTSWTSTCQQASWVASLKLACLSSDWWPMTEHQLCFSVCLRTAHSSVQTEVEILWCPGHYCT